MTDVVESRRNAFVRWMERESLSAAAVARKAGIPGSTLYSYLAGKSDSLKGTTQDKIAAAFDTRVETLFNVSESERPSTVGVWGKIGARADVFPLSDYSDTPMYDVDLPPTVASDEAYVAFEIEGFSMPPAEPGWIAVFRHVQVPVEELINTPCLVDTADGRRLFKRLRRGYAPERYNLESWDGSPLMEDVQITAALPFAALTPGRRSR